MANRTKFWHFNTSGGFYGELLSNTGLTDTPENRAQALVSTDNGCYHYIVFIKETDQIYTHGNLYDCSTFNGSEVKSLLTGLTNGEILDNDKAMTIISKLHYLINQNAGNIAVLESEKADKSEVEILRANVEENAEVTAKALNDLNDNIIENEEITSAAINDLYSKIGSVSSSGSGGSSGEGSGAYAEVSHGTNDTTFELTPNTFHVWDEVSELTLTLGDETAGVANEFVFQFTSGETTTSLTLPDDIKWANDSAPTIMGNMIYQVSILKGLASALEFSNASSLVENKVTLSISGTKYLISLQYAAASSIVVQVRTVDGPISVSISSGEMSNSVSPVGPMIDDNAYIELITPNVDTNYNYIW